MMNISYMHLIVVTPGVRRRDVDKIFWKKRVVFLGRKMGWVFPKTNWNKLHFSHQKNSQKRVSIVFFCLPFLCHVGCEDCNSWCVGCRTSLILFVFMVKSSTALMTRATGVCHLTAKAIWLWSSEQTWKRGQEKCQLHQSFFRVLWDSLIRGNWGNFHWFVRNICPYGPQRSKFKLAFVFFFLHCQTF